MWAKGVAPDILAATKIHWKPWALFPSTEPAQSWAVLISTSPLLSLQKENDAVIAALPEEAEFPRKWPEEQHLAPQDCNLGSWIDDVVLGQQVLHPERAEEDFNWFGNTQGSSPLLAQLPGKVKRAGNKWLSRAGQWKKNSNTPIPKLLLILILSSNRISELNKYILMFFNKITTKCKLLTRCWDVSQNKWFCLL